MDRRKLYGEIERPHLDGSSSDSDTDVNLQPTSTSVQNFARTSIQTQRFELQHELEGLNLDNIPGRFDVVCLFATMQELANDLVCNYSKIIYHNYNTKD